MVVFDIQREPLIYISNKISLSLLFSRLNSPSSHSLSSQDRCSIPLIFLGSFFSLRCGLTSTEQRGRISSLNQLLMLCLVHYCFSLLQRHTAGSWTTWRPPGPPGPFLLCCFPVSQSPYPSAWLYLLSLLLNGLPGLKHLGLVFFHPHPRRVKIAYAGSLSM